MGSILENTKTVLHIMDTDGPGWIILGLYVACLLYLLIFDKRSRRFLSVPALLFTLIILNPILYMVVWNRLFSYAYWRSFWMLPVIPVIGYTFVTIIGRMSRTWTRTAAAAGCMALLLLTGSTVYTKGGEPAFTARQNMFKIPTAVINICNYLLELEEVPTVLMDSNLFCYTRQYSAQFRQMYGRDMLGFIADPQEELVRTFGAMEKEVPDLWYVYEQMNARGYRYLVRSCDKFDDTGYFYRNGFESLDVIDNYRIYKIRSDRRWSITSYSSATGNQCMCYTIRDLEGHLVIVDGGYTEDADRLLEAILANGGHVDAWILTHPDFDHVGAFNRIMTENAGQVTVDHIYTTAMNRERFLETADFYDDIEEFDAFYDLCQALPQTEFLEEGDALEVIGLQMDVLHAWDSDVDALPDHLTNNGSLVFRLTGKQDSILFTGDISQTIGDRIMERHGQDLQVTYVQCAHHGNWGLSTSFYDQMDPLAVFMDGPEWLIEDTTGKYDAPALKKYWDDRGVLVCSFRSAPNTIYLF